MSHINPIALQRRHSELGRIRLGDKGLEVDPEAGLVYGVKGHTLGSPNRYGYLQVDGRFYGLTRPYVHRLVWESVHGAIPEGMEINHINGVKTDNRIANLELVTHQQNIQHAYDTGLKTNQGMKHPRRKLDDEMVYAIRAARAAGERLIDVAARFNINHVTVSDVALRKSWSHLPERIA